MASNDPSLRRLARQLTSMQKDIRDLQTVPQLAHSSLDDHGMPVYDADGNLTVTIGKQADGTWGAPPVKGPVPPQPAGVEAEGDAGAIRASWQGVFWAGAAKPMDFEAVEVLVDGTVYAGIHDPQGGSVSVPALGGVRTVSFRTLSQAGVVSAAMGHVQVTVEPRVSEQMQELHENLDELNDVTLPELRDDLTDSAEDLQGKLDNLNARVDDLIVDGGGSGNFTTYSINEPSGDGTGEGDQWFRVVNGEVLGQWRWDGTAWQAVTLTDAIIAGIDLSKLVSNGNLSEIVANKMFTDLFAANKITSQEIAAGSITTEKIAAEGIVADVIQGGSFVGESFEGGTFMGGLIKTSNALPGQVTLSDQGYVDNHGASYPGLRISPAEPHDETRPPGIGSNENGMILTGGTDSNNNRAFATLQPELAALRSRNYTDNRDAQLYAQGDKAALYASTPAGRGEVRATPDQATVRVTGEDGLNTARISALGNTVTLFSATGGQRYLELNSSGIWIRTGPSSNQKSYNLEETAQDSGWNSFPVKAGITASSDLAYRNKNGVIYFRGTVNGDWGKNVYTDIVTGLPASMRPASDTIALSPDSTDTSMIFMMTSTGTLRAWKQNAGRRTAWLSVLSYPLG